MTARICIKRLRQAWLTWWSYSLIALQSESIQTLQALHFLGGSKSPTGRLYPGFYELKPAWADKLPILQTLYRRELIGPGEINS